MDDLLKKMQLFKGFDEAEILQVAGSMQEVSPAKDELIFNEGDEGDALYLIGEGSVRVEKKDIQGQAEVVAILHQGESFGEVSLVDHEVRSASCLANEDTRLYRLSREDFEVLLNSDKDLALKAYQALVGILCERLRSTNQALTFSRSLLQGVMDKEK